MIDVIQCAKELKFDYYTLENLNNENLYQFFSDKFVGGQLYLKPDHEHAHSELKGPSVTLKLLWQEYCDTASSNLFPVSYSSFCQLQ